ADLVDRLVPRNPGPLAIDELERIFEPPLAVLQFAHCRALGAMRAAIDRAVPARLLADPHAVLHLGGHRAADRAMGANVLACFDRRARLGRRPGLGLAHAAERQGADRRKSAGDEAGAAQETAAVERAARLACERGSQRAAARLAFRPFDQHGRLPTWSDIG